MILSGRAKKGDEGDEGQPLGEEGKATKEEKIKKIMIRKPKKALLKGALPSLFPLSSLLIFVSTQGLGTWRPSRAIGKAEG